MGSKGMLKGRFNSNAKRGKTWQKYYSDVKPTKDINDFVHKECEECGNEMILDYKKRSNRFCSLSCSTKYRHSDKEEKSEEVEK